MEALCHFTTPLIELGLEGNGKDSTISDGKTESLLSREGRCLLPNFMENKRGAD